MPRAANVLPAKILKLLQREIKQLAKRLDKAEKQLAKLAIKRPKKKVK